jgi:hypothetical protein
VFDRDARAIVFKPNRDEFKLLISEILEEAHQSIAKVGTLSDRPEFNDHLRVKENEGQKDNPDDPYIMEKIINHPDYNSMQREIDEIIKDS